MRHYFEFDGMKSSDFGVFISGTQTMGAAGRDVDEIVVPGRDGNLTIDNGRFNAISHVYPAFIAEDAKEGLKGLRNALLSKRGHKRLSDTVHPDEFYRAYYEHGLEPELTANLRHSELEIEFTRDPRRFLVSGDTPQDVALNTETLSGSSVSFDNATGADRITGLSVSVMAAQAGNGDPSPTNIRPITGRTGATVTRTGKNLLDLSAYTIGRSENGITYTVNDDMTISASGTATGTSSLYFTIPIAVAKKWAGKNLNGAPSVNGCYLRVEKKLTPYTRYAVDSGNGAVISNNILNETGDILVLCRIDTGTTVNGVVFKPMIRDASFADSAYEPYNGTVYPVTWSEAGTVYGGTLDVINGTLTVTMAMVDLGTLNWKISSSQQSRFYAQVPAPYYKMVTNLVFLCSQYRPDGIGTSTSGYWGDNGTIRYNFTSGTASNTHEIYIHDDQFTDATTFKAAMSGVQLVYELAEPVIYQLTPTEITTLIGENNIWADCGDVSVTLQLPSTLINPTLFASSPLIRVHGQGTLYIGNTAITVSGSLPYVDIDTEIADCSYEGQNANQYVTFSGLDFPKLEPGENYITFTGFTAVEVTPRWWRL